MIDIDRKDYHFTLLRLDFKAKIKTKEGYKTVLIEIQKVKLSTDIMRFRCYLGSQYQNKANSYILTSDSGGDIVIGMPIITIYFLGYVLKDIHTPMLKISRDYVDLTKGSKVSKKSNFVEALTHDSYIIQINLLNKEYKSGIERLLSVFDQSFVISQNRHILDIDEDLYPDKYQPLIKRLQKAAFSNSFRDKMDIEDDMVFEIENSEKIINQKDEIIKKEKQKSKEQEQKLVEKDKLIKELKKKLEDLKP